jgi:hypothetical protein
VAAAEAEAGWAALEAAGLAALAAVAWAVVGLVVEAAAV